MPSYKTITSSSLDFGTLQIQLVPKFVSLVWIQRRQHKFSYPCFFHFAIKFWSAIFSWMQKSYNSKRKKETINSWLTIKYSIPIY